MLHLRYFTFEVDDICDHSSCNPYKSYLENGLDPV
jgi:hypothetical protein